jgi:hypothetical protein
MEPNPERKSGISRILSDSPEQEAAMAANFETVLRSQEFGSYERLPTPQERAVIEALLPMVREFVESQGGTSVPGITSANIHLLDPERLAPEDREAIDRLNIGGLYDRDRQAVFVLPDDSLLTTAQRLAHELMHFHSFQSVHSTGPDANASPRRMGLSIFDAPLEKRYFRDLDEAIVEELTMRLDSQSFAGLSPLRADIGHRNQLRERLDAPRDVASVTTRQLQDGRWQTRIETWRYGNARERLHSLVAQLYKRNSGRFATEEDVFRLFVKATLTGQLLEIARLIERTLGPGSFAALARETMVTNPTEPEEPERRAQNQPD